MTQNTASKLKRGFVNFLGGIGYVFLILEGLLLVLAYFASVQSLSFLHFAEESTQAPAPPVIMVPDNDGSLAFVIFGAIVTVTMIVIAIFAFIKIPSMIVNTSRRVVHKTAELGTPAALRVQHKKDTKKNRKRITPKLVIILKVVCIAVAAGLVFGSQFLPIQELEFSLMLMSALWLLGISAGFFILQYVSAKLLRVEQRLLW